MNKSTYPWSKSQWKIGFCSMTWYKSKFWGHLRSCSQPTQPAAQHKHPLRSTFGVIGHLVPQTCVQVWATRGNLSSGVNIVVHVFLLTGGRGLKRKNASSLLIHPCPPPLGGGGFLGASPIPMPAPRVHSRPTPDRPTLRPPAQPPGRLGPTRTRSVQGICRRGKFRMGYIPHLSQKIKGKNSASPNLECIGRKGILGLQPMACSPPMGALLGRDSLQMGHQIEHSSILVVAFAHHKAVHGVCRKTSWETQTYGA